MGPYPECWVEEKSLYELEEELGAIGSSEQELDKVEDGREEVEGEVLGGASLQEVENQLHAVQLHQLQQEAG